MGLLADITNFEIKIKEESDNNFDKDEKEHVVETLTETGKEIIEITQAQKYRFAGNMLQVMGDKPYLVMSNAAFSSLTDEQKNTIEKSRGLAPKSLRG